jgi:hypothetical protein
MDDKDMTTLFLITSSHEDYYPDPINICVVASKERADSIVEVLNKGAAIEKAYNEKFRPILDAWWEANPVPERANTPNNDEYDALCKKWNDDYVGREDKFFAENYEQPEEVLNMMSRFSIATRSQYDLTYGYSKIEMVE